MASSLPAPVPEAAVAVVVVEEREEKKLGMDEEEWLPWEGFVALACGAGEWPGKGDQENWLGLKNLCGDGEEEGGREEKWDQQEGTTRYAKEKDGEATYRWGVEPRRLVERGQPNSNTKTSTHTQKATPRKQREKTYLL